jgi:hypothetical protein
MIEIAAGDPRFATMNLQVLIHTPEPIGFGFSPKRIAEVYSKPTKMQWFSWRGRVVVLCCRS